MLVEVEGHVVVPRVCPGRRGRVAKRSRNAKNRRIPSKMLTWPLAKVGEPGPLKIGPLAIGVAAGVSGH